MNGLMNLGPHASYILAAYGAAVLVLGALIGWIRIDARQQVQLLADLEAKGIRRRSARGVTDSGPGKRKTGKSK